MVRPSFWLKDMSAPRFISPTLSGNPLRPLKPIGPLLLPYAEPIAAVPNPPRLIARLVSGAGKGLGFVNVLPRGVGL